MIQTKEINQTDIQNFQHKVWDFYAKNKREFVWRERITPYNVFVSEVMLQQTQTSRVTVKFSEWLNLFANFESLAAASTHQVLHAWQGLGYNRRGLALHKSAQIIVEQFAGQLPNDLEILQSLPGIGPNTAASICAFAFNRPVVFIETNIRTVFLYEFFSGQKNISDKQLLPIIQQALDQQNSREWYYALMDYGVYLKTSFKANNKSSKHYSRQSKFIGSRREVRGAIIRILTNMVKLSKEELCELVALQLPNNNYSVDFVLQDLIKEQLVVCQDDVLRL